MSDADFEALKAISRLDLCVLYVCRAHTRELTLHIRAMRLWTATGVCFFSRMEQLSLIYDPIGTGRATPRVEE